MNPFQQLEQDYLAAIAALPPAVQVTLFTQISQGMQAIVQLAVAYAAAPPPTPPPIPAAKAK